MVTTFSEEAPVKTEENVIETSSIVIKNEGDLVKPSNLPIILDESSVTLRMKDESSNTALKMEDESFNTAFKIEDESSTITLKMEDESSNISLKTEGDPSNIAVKIEDEPADTASIKEDQAILITRKIEDQPANIDSKMEDKPSDVTSILEDEFTGINFKMEDEPSVITSKVEDESFDITIKMEDEPVDKTGLKEDQPTDIIRKMEGEISDIAFKTGVVLIEPCLPKKEADFKVAKLKIKTNPDEIDFMLDVKDSQPSDIEFSEDSSSDIEIATEDKDDTHEIIDKELELVDSLPKVSVNELDDDKIEQLLAAKVLPYSLPSSAKIESLGRVLSIAGPYSIIIQSNVLGFKKDSQVLDEDTLLVHSDRTVIGTIFETFGPVSRPLYLVRFPKSAFVKKELPSDGMSDDSESSKDNLESALSVIAQPPPEAFVMPPKKIQVGQEVFYVKENARVVPVKEILKIKGTDASNQNDEEIDSDEMEFSDDDKEHEYKLLKKSRARKSNNKQTSVVACKPPNPTATHKRKRNRANKKIIDEDKPDNDEAFGDQDTEKAASRIGGDDYSRLLKSYEDL